MFLICMLCAYLRDGVSACFSSHLGLLRGTTGAEPSAHTPSPCQSVIQPETAESDSLPHYNQAAIHKYFNLCVFFVSHGCETENNHVKSRVYVFEGQRECKNSRHGCMQSIRQSVNQSNNQSSMGIALIHLSPSGETQSVILFDASDGQHLHHHAKVP